MSEEVVDSLQKVTINLVYYGDNVTIEMQKDKTLEMINQTAYQYFKPHGKLKLYFKNKELTPYLNYTIGKYFQKLKNIDILVKDTSRSDKNNEDNKNTLQDSSTIPINKRNMNYCWDCKNYPINIFCRDCCAFICKNCNMNMNNAHYSHRTITLYPENLAKSANLYKNILLEDLNEFETNRENKKSSPDKKEKVNVDINVYKKELNLKLQRLFDKIKLIKSYQQDIEYYFKNKEQCINKINKAIDDVQKISDAYDENGENNDLKETFTKINKVEKENQKLLNLGKSIEEFELINSTIENALKTIGEKMDDVINQADEVDDKGNIGEEEKEEGEEGKEE